MKFFMESHIHASVMESVRPMGLKQRSRTWLYRHSVGRYLNGRVELCYPISEDCAEIATHFFGVSLKKTRVCPLGVDTDLFTFRDSREAMAARRAVRKRLGYSADDVVCIYTGRFAESKGPEVLAAAVELLRQRGEPFRSLFVGSGTSADRARLERHEGTGVHPFVPARDLPSLYWAADIGVWPRQESTSQLDAAACGLPIVLSDRVTVRERVDGNGLFYAEGSVSDLADKLLTLKRADVRERLGRSGSEKMEARYSWRRIASERLADYSRSLAWPV
jgi:glycosyltransferase involved in cell wall biosynthesis